MGRLYIEDLTSVAISYETDETSIRLKNSDVI